MRPAILQRLGRAIGLVLVLPLLFAWQSAQTLLVFADAGAGHAVPHQPVSANRWPAGVSRTRRPSGSMSGVPTSRARAAMPCETVEVLVRSSTATSCMEPSRESSRRSRSREMSTHRLSRHPKRFVHDSHVDVNGCRVVDCPP